MQTSANAKNPGYGIYQRLLEVTLQQIETETRATDAPRSLRYVALRYRPIVRNRSPPAENHEEIMDPQPDNINSIS